MKIIVQKRTTGKHFWTRANGDVINVDEMSIEHLRGAMKKLINHLQNGVPDQTAIVCDIRTEEEQNAFSDELHEILNTKKELTWHREKTSKDDPQYLPF